VLYDRRVTGGIPKEVAKTQLSPKDLHSRAVSYAKMLKSQEFTVKFVVTGIPGGPRHPGNPYGVAVAKCVPTGMVAL
jgi:hypothetical protein